MEKKSPLMIRFPSQVPSVYIAQFPPGQGRIATCCHEAWSLILRESDQNKVYLVNPPSSVLKRLLEEVQSLNNITLFYDRLPQKEEGMLFRSFRIMVPSLYFYYLFRQQESEVELVHPLPAEPSEGAKAREEAKKYFMLKNEVCLWIDDRLIAPRYRKGLLQGISKILNQRADLKVVWVRQHRGDSDLRIQIVHPEEADQKKLWLAGDILVTLSPVSQSMAPLHIQCLANKMAVITDDRGDHGEWVNHLLTGFLLSQKGMFQELGRYLLRLLNHRDLLRNFKQNGPLLIEKVLKRQ